MNHDYKATNINAALITLSLNILIDILILDT